MAKIRHLENREIVISNEIIRFRCNLVHNSTFVTRWQSRDQIWFFKFKMADCCHIENRFWPTECQISV